MATELISMFKQISSFHNTDTFFLEKSKDPAKSGTYYFDLSYKKSGQTSSVFRLWSSELIRFFRSLDRVLQTNFETLGGDKNGTYPLEINLLSSSNILGIFVFIRDGQKSLVIRRLSSTFQDKEGGTHYCKYMNWSKLGQYIAEVRVPINNNCRDILTSFVENFQNEVSFIMASFFEDRATKDLLKTLKGFEQIAERITLSGSCLNLQRTMEFDLGLPDFSSFTLNLLEKPLLELLLTNCSKVLNPNEISTRMDNKLDAKSIKRMLSWYMRYSEEAIQYGFLVSPYSTNELGDTIVANRVSIFGSDPLLLALVPVTQEIILRQNLASVNLNADWIPVPQFKSSPPFDQTISKGHAQGPIFSNLGKFVYPSPQTADGIKNLAKPGSSLKKNRWRVLQMMNLYSCQLANTSSSIKPGFEQRIVLQLQRLALLINDVENLFFDDAEITINQIIANTKKVFLDAINSDSKSTPMLQPSELPRITNNG